MDNLRAVFVDGISIQTTDQGAQAIDKLNKQLADSVANIAKLTADHAAALASKDAELAKKDAEIDAIKAQVIDGAALDAKVEERSELVAKAKKLAPNVETKGKSEKEIRRDTVAAIRGADAVAGKSEAYIDAAFDLLQPAVDNTVRDALKGAARPSFAAIDAKNGQAAYEKRLVDGWKVTDALPAQK